MQFDSFQVDSAEQVHVSVKTIPPGMLKLNQSYTVPNNQPGKTTLQGTSTIVASPHDKESSNVYLENLKTTLVGHQKP